MPDGSLKLSMLPIGAPRSCIRQVGLWGQRFAWFGVCSYSLMDTPTLIMQVVWTLEDPHLVMSSYLLEQ